MLNSNFSPETFNKYYNSFFNYNLSLFKLIKSIQKNQIDNVLDLACGTGLTTRSLSKVFKESKIVGIDSDENLINYANIAYQPMNVEYKHLNVLKCHELNILYDLVIIKSALHLIHDEYIFDNYINILKPNGKFIAIERTDNSVDSFPLFNEAKEIWKLQYDKQRKRNCMNHYFNKENYEIETYRFGQKVIIDKEIYIQGIRNKEMSCLWDFDNNVISNWIETHLINETQIEVFEEYDIISISKIN